MQRRRCTNCKAAWPLPKKTQQPLSSRTSTTKSGSSPCCKGFSATSTNATSTRPNWKWQRSSAKHCSVNTRRCKRATHRKCGSSNSSFRSCSQVKPPSRARSTTTSTRRVRRAAEAATSTTASRVSRRLNRTQWPTMLHGQSPTAQRRQPRSRCCMVGTALRRQRRYR